MTTIIILLCLNVVQLAGSLYLLSIVVRLVNTINNADKLLDETLAKIRKRRQHDNAACRSE